MTTFFNVKVSPHHERHVATERADEILTSPTLHILSPLRPDVRKAIIPAAGLGTRFLPATKASQRDAPLVDKPLIQYVVEEAVASGIEDIIVITGARANARSRTISIVPAGTGRKSQGVAARARCWNQMRHISNLANFCYVRQPEAMGLGHAVLCAQHLIGDEPFAVILGDEIIDASVSRSRSTNPYLQAAQGAVLGVQEVPQQEVSRYGSSQPVKRCAMASIASTTWSKNRPRRCALNLAVIGRYVLPPEIFPILRKTPPGKNGEIQLTDALRQLVKNTPMFAHEVEGQRHDAGDKLRISHRHRGIGAQEPVPGPAFGEFLQQRLRPTHHRRASSRPRSNTHHHYLATGRTDDRRPNRATARHHTNTQIGKLEPHG